MASSASLGAYGMELLATQRLYYNAQLNGGISIFLLFSSQFLGFGLAGLMRKSLVYPKNMLWPYNLPINSMLENLHRPKSETKKQLQVFGIFFAAIFCWGESVANGMSPLGEMLTVVRRNRPGMDYAHLDWCQHLLSRQTT